MIEAEFTNFETGNVSADKQIFNLAIAFHEAALRSAEGIEDIETGATVSPTSPMIVNFGFAAELYLKALLSLTTSQTIKNHRLNVIFQRLPSCDQTAIAAKYHLLNGRHTKQLLSDILSFSHAFVEWRYIYEQGTIQINVQCLVHFCQAVYTVVISKKPDWTATSYLNQRISSQLSHPIFDVKNLGGGAFVRLAGYPTISSGLKK